MNIKKFAITTAFFFPALALAQGALENPANNTTDSGIGIISGWHCSASKVEAIVDNKSIGFAYVGSERGDTASICGKSNTGFSLLINFNEFSRGSHNLKIYANGVLFGESNFKTTQSGGTAFLVNKSRTVDVNDFPNLGSTATLTWNQSKQSFVVTSIQTNASPPTSTATGLVKLYGKVTINYKFNSSSNTYSDSFSFSPTDYNTSNQSIETTIPGKNKPIRCSLINQLGYEFLCMIMDSTGALDSFLFNVSSTGSISGKYEYCLAYTSSTTCATELVLTPDGTVTGNIIPRSAAVLNSPTPITVKNLGQKENLKALQLEQEAVEPSTESATQDQIDAVREIHEMLTH